MGGWEWGCDGCRETDGRREPTDLTSGGNRGTLTHGRLERRRDHIDIVKLGRAIKPPKRNKPPDCTRRLKAASQRNDCHAHLESGSWFCGAPPGRWDGGMTWLCCRENCPSCPRPRLFSWKQTATQQIFFIFFPDFHYATKNWTIKKCKTKYSLAILESPTQLLGESKHDQHDSSNPNLHEVLERSFGFSFIRVSLFSGFKHIWTKQRLDT